MVSVAAIIGAQHLVAGDRRPTAAIDPAQRPRGQDLRRVRRRAGEARWSTRSSRCDGGDPAKVGFVEVGNVDYRVGLDRGHYDVVWVFDGWDVIRLRDLEGMDDHHHPLLRRTGRSCIPDWYTPLLATSEDAIADDPELVARLHGRHRRGLRAGPDRPDRSGHAPCWRRPPSSTPIWCSAAPSTWRPATPSDPAWGLQDAAVWAGFAAFLTEAGLLDGAVDADAAFTNDFLPGGRPATPTTSTPVTAAGCAAGPALIEVDGLAHRFGSLPVAVGCDAARFPSTGSWPWSDRAAAASRTVLRVLAGLLVPDAGRPQSTAGRSSAGPARSPSWPNATCCCRGGGRSTTPPSEPRRAASDRAEARRAAAALFERFGLAGFERSWPDQLVRRACASGWPCCAPSSPALDVLAARRALRRARRPDPPRPAGAGSTRCWSPTRRTVVLVTHDVEEALLLADPVVVLSPRPGRVVHTVDAPWPHPRAGRAGDRPRLRSAQGGGARRAWAASERLRRPTARRRAAAGRRRTARPATTPKPSPKPPQSTSWPTP